MRDGRQADRNAVCGRARAIGQPHGQAHEHVAQNAERDGLREAKPDVRRDADGPMPNAPPPNSWTRPTSSRTAIHDRAREIAGEHGRPVREESRVETRPLVQVMTSRRFPVNSSAPPMTTRARPTLNTTPRARAPAPRPFRSCPPSRPSRIPPNAMNAGEHGETERASVSSDAFAKPTSSAPRAISAGSTASNVWRELAAAHGGRKRCIGVATSRARWPRVGRRLGRTRVEQRHHLVRARLTLRRFR